MAAAFILLTREQRTGRPRPPRDNRDLIALAFVLIAVGLLLGMAVVVAHFVRS